MRAQISHLHMENRVVIRDTRGRENRRYKIVDRQCADAVDCKILMLPNNKQPSGAVEDGPFFARLPMHCPVKP